MNEREREKRLFIWIGLDLTITVKSAHYVVELHELLVEPVSTREKLLKLGLFNRNPLELIWLKPSELGS